MSATFCHPVETGAEITSPKLAELFAYWRSKTNGRFAPPRCHIDPVEIPRLLPFVWLADVVDGGTDFRFRLGGDKLVQFIGRRMHGETIAGHCSHPFFAGVGRAFALCVGSKKPLLRPAAPTSYAQRDYADIEVLLLPLSDNGTDVSQIFGGFVTLTAPACPADLTPP